MAFDPTDPPPGSPARGPSRTPSPPRTDALVYREHAAELTRYATVLVGPDDAPDIVSDAVLGAFAAPSWPTVDNRRAYLFRAVLTTAWSWHRSNGRRRRRERVVALRPVAAPHDAAGVPDAVDVHAALATLSPQQRAVVYFAYWEDQTPAHIAEILGVGEGTVRKQLARAREQLRTRLGKVNPND